MVSGITFLFRHRKFACGSPAKSELCHSPRIPLSSTLERTL
jgi:hypothetical protein